MNLARATSHSLVLIAVVLSGCSTSSDGDAHDGGARALHDASATGVDSGRDAGRPWQPPQLNPPEPDAGVEFQLSETGLYRDITRKRLAPDLIAFEPTYELWSDGADKQRWLRLPEGERIDSSNMDHWQFPVGTMLFKEFSLAGKRLETRLIMRTGSGERGYWMGAFVWNDDESDARFVPDGEANVRGTEHDVPKVKNCFTCHEGDQGRVLGFSAVQQPDADSALLTAAPATPFAVPGDTTTAAALGYLHANCAHCHNPDGSARPDTDMNLRLMVTDERPEDTYTVRSTVGVAMQYFEDSPLSRRVSPGQPGQSGVLYRMLERGMKTQMPPLASELVDDDGAATVRAWIEGL